MAHGLSCSAACGRDLPGPGLEPVSLALAGRFLTTAPPGKPLTLFFIAVIQFYFLPGNGRRNLIVIKLEKLN